MDNVKQLKETVASRFCIYETLKTGVILTEMQDIWPVSNKCILVLPMYEHTQHIEGLTHIDRQKSSASKDETGFIFLTHIPNPRDFMLRDALKKYENAVRALAIAEAAVFFEGSSHDIVSRVLNEFSNNAMKGEELYDKSV